MPKQAVLPVEAPSVIEEIDGLGSIVRVARDESETDDKACRVDFLR